MSSKSQRNPPRRDGNVHHLADSRRKRRRRGSWRIEYLLVLLLIPVAVFLSQNPGIIGAEPSLTPLDGADETTPSAGLLSTGAGCRIKGNISIDTGERIYHVPGQEHYWETKISPEYGERWFCSEAEARAAGWRRARR